MIRTGSVGGFQSGFKGGGGVGLPSFMPKIKAGAANLVDMVSGVAATNAISGVRYGIVNGVVTEFGVNQSALEDDGFRGCPAYTQYFSGNEVPVTQSITLAAGSYCLWIEGSGSATFNGLTATHGVPKFFTLASSFTGNCVISGTVTKCMFNSGLFPAPFSPTQGTVKSFVSETGSATNGTSFDLDNIRLTRLKNILRGAGTQGHLELEIKTNFDSNIIPNSTTVNVFTVNNNPLQGLYWRKDGSGNKYIRISDAAYNLLSPVDLATIGKLYNIKIDWGTHPTGQKMRLTINGVQTALANFAGWGTGDLFFFDENTIHAGWIKKDSFKIYDRPRW